MQSNNERIANLEYRIAELECIIAKLTAGAQARGRMALQQEGDLDLLNAIRTHFTITSDTDSLMTAGEIIDRLHVHGVDLRISDHQIAIRLARLLPKYGVRRYRDMTGRYYVGIRERNTITAA